MLCLCWLGANGAHLLFNQLTLAWEDMLRHIVFFNVVEKVYLLHTNTYR